MKVFNRKQKLWRGEAGMNNEENDQKWFELSAKVLDKVEVIKQSMYLPEECTLQEDIVTSREEYEDLLGRYRDKYEKFDRILNEIAMGLDYPYFYYNAYCAACGKDVVMIYHGLKEGQFRLKNGLAGFREEFFCPVCGGQGRIRYVSSRVKKEYKRGMKVYMYEYKAPGYRAVSKFVSPKDLVGSEYFGAEYRSGEYINGILHEDAAALSFEDESFDIMVSLDVFEHIYFYEKALREVWRVLKPGGKLLLTIPMSVNRDYTEDRAKIVNGETILLKEPIYHGGGTETEYGLLEYTTFGWDILNVMKSVGFSKVLIRTYYSINEAYFGTLTFIFELVK